jgi:hypothetical protein
MKAISCLLTMLAAIPLLCLELRGQDSSKLSGSTQDVGNGLSLGGGAKAAVRSLEKLRRDPVDYVQQTAVDALAAISRGTASMAATNNGNDFHRTPTYTTTRPLSLLSFSFLSYSFLSRELELIVVHAADFGPDLDRHNRTPDE